MSRPAPRTLSRALDGLTKAIAPATVLARVQGVWEEAAGAVISSSAQPSAERGGVLTITCEGAAWAQELDLMSGELIPRINHALGEELVRELRCRTG